jgi:hypothetical protein
MFSKAKLNFVVDAIILVAFLATAVSGIALLDAPHGGYQGGRNPDFGQTVLLLGRDGWNDVHVWGGLAMMAGIVVHLALHWRWIVCTLKRLPASGKRGAALGTAQPVPVVVTDLDN